MSGSGELNIVSVVALVLGGVAAMVLAIVVATRDPGRATASASASASASADIAPEPPPSASGELPAGEVEYQLDTSTPSEEPRAP
jgi:hypothetical protein